MCRRFLLLIFIASLLIVVRPVAAQTPTPSGPIYIVKPKENLSDIATRFNVSLNDLITANGIANPDQISAGQQLIIPGLEGVSGVLDTTLINFGDSYRSLMRRAQISESLFRKLNRIVSPSEFYVGASMIIPKQQDAPQLIGMSPATGESLLEMAIRNHTDVWTVSGLNALAGTWAGLPGDTLYTTGAGSGQTSSGLPSAFENAVIPTLPFKQGGTAEVIVKTQPGVTLGGMLVDFPLHFFPLEDGRQVALQGIHAMLTPGVYPLQLDATLPDGTKQSYEQMVLVNSGYYPKDPALVVDPTTIDPAVTGPEDKQILTIVSAITTQKLWQGVFSLPVATPFCIYSRFGDRRSFNGSDYIYFHAGVDYGICSDTHPYDIYAAAAGVVVFDGPLTVRGNATIIDHGWGIFTGYWHQEESYVSVGQQVQAGQLIGKIGKTGRVTGPHLHWEVWTNGVQVDPLDWLTLTYP